MEGPSLYLAASQLQPFAGQQIRSVSGNSRIGIDRLAGKTLLEIFSWEKHLVFQFDAFALRVHFMLWGPFAARKVRAFPREEIADVLLDQDIFTGVGNIIKNEVLFRTRTSPFARVKTIPPRKLRAIVADARTFSFRFLELRKVFALRKIWRSTGAESARGARGRSRDASTVSEDAAASFIAALRLQPAGAGVDKNQPLRRWTGFRLPSPSR